MCRLLALLLVAVSMSSVADGYPNRPVKLIMQGAAGSGPDALTRIVAERLERIWKQGVVIVNQPGAGGLIAAELAAAAEPDGYTLFVPTISTFVILPEMHEKVPIDLHRAFAPIGLLAETPMMIGVSPALGVGSLVELAARARKQPNDLFYAANNRGSLPHLTAERWRDLAGAPITFVPYSGAAAGLQDLVGGRVSIIVESFGALAGAVKAGAVKPLAVASSARLANYPNVPTVAETIPGFTAVGWIALAAPSATSRELIRRLNEDLNAALADPELLQRFHDLGAATRPMSPAQIETFILSEEQLWRPVIRQMGLKAR